MPVFTPFKDMMRGCHGFLRGVRWLKQRPLMLLLLFIPMLLSATLLAFSWGMFYGYQDRVFEWIMFARPESWWGLGFYYLVKGLLYVVILLLGLIFYALIVSIISSPVYDYVSIVVERSVIDGPAAEVSLWESFKLMGEELKKALFIVALSLGVLMIPGVNVLTPVVTAFCIGWGVYDYPLARRGWSFRRRLSFVSGHGWSVLGLGLWLLIPGVQMILMPLSIAGASILAVEDIQKSESRSERGS